MRIATPRTPRAWSAYYPAQKRLRLQLALAGASTGGAWGAVALSLAHDSRAFAVLTGQAAGADVAWVLALLLCIPVGALLSAMPLDLLSHAAGRRPAVLACALLVCAGALVGAAVSGWGQVVAGCVCGLGLGGYAIVNPKLAHELAERGHTRLIPRLAAVGPAGAGVALVAGELGGLVASEETIVCGWLAPLLGSLAVFMCAMGLPETPHWYAARGKVDAAHAALRRMTDPLEAAVGIDWVMMDAGMLGEQRTLSGADLRVKRVRTTIMVGAVLELIQVLPFGIAAMCLTPAIVGVERTLAERQGSLPRMAEFAAHPGWAAPLWAVVALATGWAVVAAASRRRRPEHLLLAWVLAGTGLAAGALTLLFALPNVRATGATAVSVYVVIVAIMLVAAQYLCVAPACLGATDPLVPPWLLRSQRRAQAVARPLVQMIAVAVPTSLLAAGVGTPIVLGCCVGAQVVSLLLVLLALPRLNAALR